MTLLPALAAASQAAGEQGAAAASAVARSPSLTGEESMVARAGIAFAKLSQFLEAYHAGRFAKREGVMAAFVETYRVVYKQGADSIAQSRAMGQPLYLRGNNHLVIQVFPNGRVLVQLSRDRFDPQEPKLCEREKRHLLGYGSYKRVRLAIDVQREEILVIAKQRQNDLYPLIEEYKIHRQFKTSPYIAAAYDYGVYRKCLGGAKGLEKRAFMLMKPYRGSLFLWNQRHAGKVGREAALVEICKGYMIKDILNSVLLLHESHYIHRDIKSLNILYRLDIENNVRLCLTDFGFIGGSDSTPDPEEIGVTTSYRAPEVVLAYAGQKESLARCTSPAVDCYSVGILLLNLYLSSDYLGNFAREEAIRANPVQAYEICRRFNRSISEHFAKLDHTRFPHLYQAERIILGLLEPDPAERWTMQQALQSLTTTEEAT